MLNKNNRDRIREALKLNSKAAHSIELLGCNKEFFYHFIKFQLPYDMTDDEFRNDYEIDHIVALAIFYLSDQENQLIACSWQNCRPLLKSKNRSKRAKRDLWSEVLQKLKVVFF